MLLGLVGSAMAGGAKSRVCSATAVRVADWQRGEGADRKENVVDAGAKSLVIHYSNITLCGRKSMDLLADFDNGKETKPHILAWVEHHLMGKYLNAARRRFKSLG